MKYTDIDRKCGLEKFDKYDIISAVSDARDQLAKERHDSRTTGTVRGGSVGALIGRNVHGVCHRKAYLRFHGIETPMSPEIELMTTMGEENETIWLAELRKYYEDMAAEHGLEVKDQDSVELDWEQPKTKGSGSVDISLWKDGKPVLSIENKLCCAITKAKDTHYLLRPPEKEVIQAANYGMRLGDKYCGGEPVPTKLVYTNRVLWHFFAMKESIKKVVLEKGWDINWSFGKPMSIGCFHREFNVDWDIDGRLRYWTAGLKDWVVTEVTRKSIDDFYAAVSHKIEESGNLGPRPTTKHIDGKSAYSACNYCEFKSVCDIGERLTPQEFKDRSQKLADELWKERLGDKK